MFAVMFQLLLAYVYGHVLEYYLHIGFHKYGRSKNSPLAFHWRDHHRASRQHLMKDSPSLREFLGVLGLALVHLPAYFVAPWFYLGLLLSCCSYLYHHWRSHIDIDWAIRKLPWHVEHHLGYQHASWGVRSNWVDRLLGTMSWKLPYNRVRNADRESRIVALWLRVSGQRDRSVEDFERRNIRSKGQR